MGSPLGEGYVNIIQQNNNAFFMRSEIKSCALRSVVFSALNKLLVDIYLDSDYIILGFK